jgi:hypothetical protein
LKRRTVQIAILILTGGAAFDAAAVLPTPIEPGREVSVALKLVQVVVQDKQTPETKAAADVDLESLLRKAAEYCRKLEGAALDFVCQEEIVETVDPTLDVRQPLVPLSYWSTDGRSLSVVGQIIKKAKRTLLYDYQCVRVKGAMTEKRTLLREDKRS